MDKLEKLKDTFARLDLQTKIWLIDIAMLRPEPKLTRIARYHKSNQDVAASSLPILKGVCVTLQVVPADLKLGSKKRIHAEARFIAYSLLAQNGYNSKGIGRMFRRDHSSVIHGFDVHEELIGTDARYSKKYQSVVNYINETNGRIAS